jgi:hypothetical protein
MPPSLLNPGIADQFKGHVNAAETLSVVRKQFKPLHRGDRDANLRARNAIRDIRRTTRRDAVVDIVVELVEASTGGELQP